MRAKWEVVDTYPEEPAGRIPRLWANYLDLRLEFDDDGKLLTQLYDKRDDFDFPIVNFLCLSSNIPESPAYGVFVSQLIRYARVCLKDFLFRGSILVSKLLKQGYSSHKLQTGFIGMVCSLTVTYDWFPVIWG